MYFWQNTEKKWYILFTYIVDTMLKMSAQKKHVSLSSVFHFKYAIAISFLFFILTKKSSFIFV